MPAVLIAGLALALPTLIWLGCELCIRRRTPPGLAKDWWADFERDFHAYASQTPAPHRPGRTRP